MSFDNVICDKCGGSYPGYYLLSDKTKGVWIHCGKCGNHAIPYKTGLNIPWKPAKPFVKKFGEAEANRIARELESGKPIEKFEFALAHSKPKVKTVPSQAPLLDIPVDANNQVYFSDAGTSGNGNFGHQKTIIVVTDSKGTVLIEEWVGDKTNNEGELIGITRAARLAKPESTIYSDSQLAVNWITLKSTTKIERLKPTIYDAVVAVHTKKINLVWIPREQNLAGHYIEEKHSL